MVNLKTKYLIYFITLFIFASCSGSDNPENTTEAQVQENSTTIKSTPVPASTPIPKSTPVPAPKPTAVPTPTAQPVSKPELISFTAEDIKSIDYINIERASSEEFHDLSVTDNDYYSEKFIEAWSGEIKSGTLDEENFMLAIYEGTSIDEDIIDSLLMLSLIHI